MRTILLVEDDEPFRTLVKKVLSKHFRVHACTNVYSAQAFLRSERLPDLIVSDLNLPGLSGFELLQFVKRSGLFCDVPVVILSGREEKEIIESCLWAGAEKFFLKPFEPEKLVAELRDVLSSKASYSKQPKC